MHVHVTHSFRLSTSKSKSAEAGCLVAMHQLHWLVLQLLQPLPQFVGEVGLRPPPVADWSGLSARGVAPSLAHPVTGQLPRGPWPPWVGVHRCTLAGSGPQHSTPAGCPYDSICFFNSLLGISPHSRTPIPVGFYSTSRRIP